MADRSDEARCWALPVLDSIKTSGVLMVMMATVESAAPDFMCSTLPQTANLHFYTMQNDWQQLS